MNITDEHRKIFDELVFNPFIQTFKFSRKLKKLIIKYKFMPVINGVVQGWVAFEMCTSDGIPIDVIQDIFEEENMKVDLEDFEKRMKEFKIISKAGKKDGLQRVSMGVNEMSGPKN